MAESVESAPMASKHVQESSQYVPAGQAEDSLSHDFQDAVTEREDFADSASGSQEWGKRETSGGVKKVQLLADFNVFLTSTQLSVVKHKAGTNPRHLVLALLDTLFSKELLAVSCAKGRCSAHNKKTNHPNRPLPERVVEAITQYTLRQFKKPTGEPCLTTTVVIDINNGKCATSRCSLNLQ